MVARRTHVQLRHLAAALVLALAPVPALAADGGCDAWFAFDWFTPPAAAPAGIETARRCLDAASTPRQLAAAHGMLSELAIAQGRQHDALAEAELAVAAGHRDGTAAVVARTLMALGNARYELWQYRSARRAFSDAVTIAAAELSPEVQARLLKDLAISERSLGHLERALPLFEAAMTRWPGWESSELAVSLLGNIAEIWLRLGAPAPAREALTRGLAAAARPHERADLLLRRARVSLAVGDLDGAAEDLESADRLAAEMSSLADRAWIASLRSWVAVQRGDTAAGIAHAARAVDFQRRGDDSRSLASALVNLAELQLGADPAAAAASFAEARHLVTVNGYPAWPWLAYLEGRLAQARHDRDTAQRAFERAAVMAEAEVARLASSRQRGVRAGSYDEIYDALIGLAVDGGGRREVDAALRAIEREHLLRETVAVHELVDADRADMPAELRARLATLEARIEGDTGATDASRMVRTELEIDEILAAWRQRSLEAPTPPPPPAGLAEITATLGPDEMLLEITTVGPRVLLVAVGAGHEQLAVSPTPAAVVAERSRALTELVAAGDPGWRGLAGRLAEDLLAPLGAGWSDGARRLIVVPDGPFYDLPYDVLPVAAGDRRVIDQLQLELQPSATALVRSRAAAASRSPAAAGGALVIANPAFGLAATTGDPAASWLPYRALARGLAPLPAVVDEARTVGSLVRDSRVLIGREASESAVTAALDGGRFGVVHVAAHALATELSPARSALLLQRSSDGRDDGLLQAREIAALHLKAGLVVLSACRTVQGPGPGEPGLRGLARGFIAAGASAVVGTLWDVDDAGTAAAMRTLYRALSAGASLGAALHSAKLEQRRRHPADPSRWAALILIGDGAATVPIHSRRMVFSAAHVMTTAALFAVALATALVLRRLR